MIWPCPPSCRPGSQIGRSVSDAAPRAGHGNAFSRSMMPEVSGNMFAMLRSGKKMGKSSLTFISPMLTASRSEEHTSELQSLMRISYAVFSWKKKNTLDHLFKTRAADYDQPRDVIVKLYL